VADPEHLLPAAVDEGLRWVSPSGTQTRQAAVDTELRGVPLSRGAGLGNWRRLRRGHRRVVVGLGEESAGQRAGHGGGVLGHVLSWAKLVHT
jgi:hypothetical protein